MTVGDVLLVAAIFVLLACWRFALHRRSELRRRELERSRHRHPVSHVRLLRHDDGR